LSPISLIAGLGNPGRQYELTRHNAGFRTVDALAARWQSSASAWREKSGALFCEREFQGQRVILAKPQLYMNLSGRPLAAVMNFYKWAPAELLVVHDDLDLPPGVLRLRAGGGDGGHKGIRSIAEELASADFIRLKIGIGRPPASQGDNALSLDEREALVTGWVLGRPAGEESKLIEATLERALLAVETVCEEGLLSAQNKFNQQET